MLHARLFKGLLTCFGRQVSQLQTCRKFFTNQYGQYERQPSWARHCRPLGRNTTSPIKPLTAEHNSSKNLHWTFAGLSALDPHDSPTSVAKPHRTVSNFNINAGFSWLCMFCTSKTKSDVNLKGQGYNASYKKILIALKQDRSELIQKTILQNLIPGCAHLLSQDMLVDMQ